MSNREMAVDTLAALRKQYGCGPVEFRGTDEARYERHLIFDHVIDPEAAGPRERYEAFARSVRDILSQRWVHTESTYERESAKRVYYLSMEFLIGRSLANNITNLLLGYEYGIFRQAVQDGWQQGAGLGPHPADPGVHESHPPAGGSGEVAARVVRDTSTPSSRDHSRDQPAAPRQRAGPLRGWHNPGWHYDDEPEACAALDVIFSNHFSRNEPGVFEPLRATLLTGGDHYMHLADLKAYLEADEGLLALYADAPEWTRKAIVNVAGSGKFSGDRTIAEYAGEIWNVESCPVL